ncbi:MAG: DUF1178 family protein [Hyphomicrobiales bacterium]|nr:DUF1178 family protein [Hyphomicrobiales bacterium]MCP5370695.1 DUF1178 family protein [Hyphomicrobiales bacterium]
MILYQLQCADGHRFEAWFRDSGTYDRQAAAGAIECPQCGGHKVSKALMAPHVARKGADTRADARAEREREDRAAEASAPAPASDPGQGPGPGPGGDPRAAELARQILRAVEKVRDHVEANFENVGDKFADEARAIHYGNAEERGIYGEATDAEAKALDDEGIEVYRLPRLPKRN